MDINTLQHQPDAITPLKTVNTNRSISSLANGIGNASRKAGTQKLESSDISTAAKAKDTKKLDDLKQAAITLNEYVQNIQRDLQFSIDKESGVMVVKVIDAKSENVIRQIPAEESLRLARYLAERDDTAISIFSSRA